VSGADEGSRARTVLAVGSRVCRRERIHDSVIVSKGIIVIGRFPGRLLPGPVRSGFPASADAAEALRVTAGDGHSFYSYSTRLSIKQASYPLNINGGTRPYSFSLSNPIVVVEPSYPGAQVSFNVIPRAVGTTILTVRDKAGNTMVRQIVVYDPGVQPLALGALPGASNPVAVGQGRGFSVSGGKAPYTVVSANPGIARVEAGRTST
jgi:hypothetical protein